jgi:hypothetical protein
MNEDAKQGTDWTGQCSLCPTRFSTRWELEEHEKKHRTDAIAKARGRTLMAAKCFSRLMDEFDGELKYCSEALTEVMDAADQLMALEAYHEQK